MLFLLATCEVLRGGRTSDARMPSANLSWGKRAQQFAIALVAISAIALTILWATYGFRYQAHGEGRQLNPPLADLVQDLSHPREVRLLRTVARFHLPSS
jgi:hypothetical protein